MYDKKEIIMKYIFFIFLVLFSAGCVSKSSSSSNSLDEDKIPVIDLKKVISGKEHEFLLSDIAKGIEYIPLEFSPECPIQLNVAPWDMYVTSNDIFILSHIIYRFDKNGKFLNKIGTIGRGPGEFITALGIAVDTIAKLLYLHSLENQIHIYDYNGKHVRTIRSSNINEPGFYFIGQTSELFYRGAGDAHHKPGNYFIRITDTLGNIRFEKKTLISGMLREGERTWWDLRSMPDGEAVFALDCMSDTIFRYQQSTLTPYMILDYGRYKVTFKALMSTNYQLETGRYFRTSLHGSTPKYFFFGVSQSGNSNYNNQKSYNIRYDKITGECISKKTTAEFFINDLDGGMPITKVGRYNKKNQWIFPIDAFEMKEELSSAHFSTAKAKDPEAKQRLMELVGKLKDEDNPVLMRVILK